MLYSPDHPDRDVSTWLKNLFKDELNVLDLEMSDKCFEVLNKLMFLNLESEKDISEVVKTDSYLDAFYNEKSDTMLNLFVKNLPAYYVEPVQHWALITVKLSLRQPTLTNFLLSSNNLENESLYHIEESIADEYSKSKYSKKNIDLMRNNSFIERKIESLEKIVSKQKNLKPQNIERINFLKIKSKEYNKRMKKQQKELNDLGFNPSLSHNELVKKADEIKELGKNVQHLKSKVHKYQNLPPNEMLVRLKVEELKVKLLEKQEEFQECLKYS